MKKVISLILAVMLVVMLAACSGWQSNVSDYSGAVSSNGGFAVVKGDYVYIVNGSVANTADNTFGKVVHGGIIRVKTSDVGSDFAKAEMVVPKMVYTEYYGEGSGIFIAGDYVYYPTPSDKKNSAGNVKNTELEFWRTKLDGTDSSIILTVSSLSTPYRFYEEGEDVYLTVYDTAKDDDGKDQNYLMTYDVKGKEIAKSNTVDGYDFGEFGGKYAYYVHTVYNETLGAKESFNELYRYSLKGDEDVVILSGEGGYSSQADQGNGEGIGTQGASFTIIKATEKYLYLSLAYVDTSVVSSTIYYALKTADIKTQAVGDYDSLILLDNGTADGPYVIVAESIYVDVDCIIYYDVYYGIVKYDYTERDRLNYGFSFLYDSEKFDNLSFVFYRNGKMYFLDDSGFAYSFELGALVDLSTGDAIANPDVDVERITYESTFKGEGFNETIFNAEVVGDYVLYLKTDEPYNNYIFSVDTKAFDKYLEANGKTGLDEDELEEEAEAFAQKKEAYDKKGYDDRLAQRLAVVSNEDIGKIINYYVSYVKE